MQIILYINVDQCVIRSMAQPDNFKTRHFNLVHGAIIMKFVIKVLSIVSVMTLNYCNLNGADEITAQWSPLWTA